MNSASVIFYPAQSSIHLLLLLCTILRVFFALVIPWGRSGEIDEGRKWGEAPESGKLAALISFAYTMGEKGGENLAVA